MSADGSILAALDEAEPRRCHRPAHDAQVCEAIAVCFLNSYANPAARAEAAASLRERWPAGHVSRHRRTCCRSFASTSA